MTTIVQPKMPLANESVEPGEGTETTLIQAYNPHERAVRVSIIVPARNAEATLPLCIDALLCQDLREPYEVVVVDDGSSDNTASVAESYSEVKVLRQPHLGAASARNVGIKSASGDVVLFTDADCLPISGWASALVSVIRAGATGAKGTYRTRQKSLSARFVQAEYEGKYRHMARLRDIDFIDTYSAAYRRDALFEVGLFDEGISAVEDQELSFRLSERGYRLRFVPEAVVYHIHADTPYKYLRKKFWIGYWKVRVVSLHPDRIVRDSHTPQSVKVQMGLITLGVFSLPLAPFTRVVRRALLACTAGFVASSLPLALPLMRRDPTVALVAPFMLLLRAVGLTAGFLAGLVQSGGDPVRRVGYRSAKRIVDLVAASSLLLLAVPLIVVAALAIKLDSPGPVFFVQWRAGKDGMPFRMYKLRTMVERAEAMREGLVRERGLREPVLKFHNDPRVTGVGRLLRRYSLDELPQLFNVLKGEMSLVGPRPEELHVVAMYSPWHRQRLKATPGVTGPMQVNGRADLSLDERVRLELDYISRASIREDALLLVRTLGAVLAGDGS